MARPDGEISAQMERHEANLSRLGNALVYLHLISDRVQAAARISELEGMLLPTVDDCRQAARLIKAVQTDLGGK